MSRMLLPLNNIVGVVAQLQLAPIVGAFGRHSSLLIYQTREQLAAQLAALREVHSELEDFAVRSLQRVCFWHGCVSLQSFRI